MVITGMALRRPDKTGHFRTFGKKALKTRDGALGATKLTTKARRREGGREEDGNADVFFAVVFALFALSRLLFFLP